MRVQNSNCTKKLSSNSAGVSSARHRRNTTSVPFNVHTTSTTNQAARARRATEHRKSTGKTSATQVGTKASSTRTAPKSDGAGKNPQNRRKSAIRNAASTASCSQAAPESGQRLKTGVCERSVMPTSHVGCAGRRSARARSECATVLARTRLSSRQNVATNLVDTRSPVNQVKRKNIPKKNSPKCENPAGKRRYPCEFPSGMTSGLKSRNHTKAQSKNLSHMDKIRRTSEKNSKASVGVKQSASLRKTTRNVAAGSCLSRKSQSGSRREGDAKQRVRARCSNELGRVYSVEELERIVNWQPSRRVASLNASAVTQCLLVHDLPRNASSNAAARRNATGSADVAASSDTHAAAVPAGDSHCKKSGVKSVKPEETTTVSSLPIKKRKAVDCHVASEQRPQKRVKKLVKKSVSPGGSRDSQLVPYCEETSARHSISCRPPRMASLNATAIISACYSDGPSSDKKRVVPATASSAATHDNMPGSTEVKRRRVSASSVTSSRGKAERSSRQQKKAEGECKASIADINYISQRLEEHLGKAGETPDKSMTITGLHCITTCSSRSCVTNVHTYRISSNQVHEPSHPVVSGKSTPQLPLGCTFNVPLPLSVQRMATLDATHLMARPVRQHVEAVMRQSDRSCSPESRAGAHTMQALVTNAGAFHCPSASHSHAYATFNPADVVTTWSGSTVDHQRRTDSSLHCSVAQPAVANIQPMSPGYFLPGYLYSSQLPVPVPVPVPVPGAFLPPTPLFSAYSPFFPHHSFAPSSRIPAGFMHAPMFSTRHQSAPRSAHYHTAVSSTAPSSSSVHNSTAHYHTAVSSTAPSSSHVRPSTARVSSSSSAVPAALLSGRGSQLNKNLRQRNPVTSVPSTTVTATGQGVVVPPSLPADCRGFSAPLTHARAGYPGLSINIEAEMPVFPRAHYMAVSGGRSQAQSYSLASRMADAGAGLSVPSAQTVRPHHINRGSQMTASGPASAAAAAVARVDVAAMSPRAASSSSIAALVSAASRTVCSATVCTSQRNSNQNDAAYVTCRFRPISTSTSSKLLTPAVNTVANSSRKMIAHPHVKLAQSNCSDSSHSTSMSTHESNNAYPTIKVPSWASSAARSSSISHLNHRPFYPGTLQATATNFHPLPSPLPRNNSPHRQEAQRVQHPVSVLPTPRSHLSTVAMPRRRSVCQHAPSSSRPPFLAVSLASGRHASVALSSPRACNRVTSAHRPLTSSSQLPSNINRPGQTRVACATQPAPIHTTAAPAAVRDSEIQCGDRQSNSQIQCGDRQSNSQIQCGDRQSDIRGKQSDVAVSAGSKSGCDEGGCSSSHPPHAVKSGCCAVSRSRYARSLPAPVAETSSSMSGSQQRSSAPASHSAPARKHRRVPQPPTGTGSSVRGRGQQRLSHAWSVQAPSTLRPILLKNNEAAEERECYASIRHEQGDVVAAGDCVLLRSGHKNEPPFIARVAAIFSDPVEDELMISVLWYYRPEHGESRRRQHNAQCTSSPSSSVTDDSVDDLVWTGCLQPAEVYASRHRDVVSVACIEDKCYVLTWNEYCRYCKFVSLCEAGGVGAVVSPVPDSPQQYPRAQLLPPARVAADRIFHCSRVLDYRTGRHLKNRV